MRGDEASIQPDLARFNDLVRDLIGLASVASDSPVERASALVSAATVIIEREVGPAMAPGALMALIEQR